MHMYTVQCTGITHCTVMYAHCTVMLHSFSDSGFLHFLNSDPAGFFSFTKSINQDVKSNDF